MYDFIYNFWIDLFWKFATKVYPSDVGSLLTSYAPFLTFLCSVSFVVLAVLFFVFLYKIVRWFF